MAKKQFKIGEYAIGGIITVEINDQVIKIEALDYDSRKLVCHRTFNQLDFEERLEYYVEDYLNALTSSYYAEKIMRWINANFVNIYQ